MQTQDADVEGDMCDSIGIISSLDPLVVGQSPACIDLKAVAKLCAGNELSAAFLEIAVQVTNLVLW